jgi:hypothetical protein
MKADKNVSDRTNIDPAEVQVPGIRPLDRNVEDHSCVLN